LSSGNTVSASFSAGMAAPYSPTMRSVETLSPNL
jgi:hypothetical protein